MDDIKSVIAKNITDLRTASSMTQLELAEKLNYSDKAVSKWERGESVPEIGTLIAISNLFGVPLDYIVKEKHEKIQNKTYAFNKIKISNRAIITGLSILFVFFIALCAYVIIDITVPDAAVHWLSFVYSVPAAGVVWLVLNSVWFNHRRNFLIISLLIWAILAALHISFLAYGTNIYKIYFLGIPAQIAVILWSRLRFKKNPGSLK